MCYSKAEYGPGYSDGTGWAGWPFYGDSIRFQEGLPKTISGDGGDSEERGWDILLSLELPQRVAPQQPWACAGKLKGCSAASNVKADPSWQHPPPPVSLVGWPRGAVSPSALACLPPWLSPAPAAGARGLVSDASDRSQSPVLRSERITRQARRRGGLASTINVLAFVSLNQILKHRP